MRRLVHQLRLGNSLETSDLGDLFRYIFRDHALFSPSLTFSEKEGVVLHLNGLNNPGEGVESAALSDARQWVADNLIFLTALGIDQVQMHLAPRPVHKLVDSPRAGEVRIKAAILSYLEEWEKGKTGRSWSEYIAREAGADGLVALTESMLGKGSWTSLVKQALLSTGRFREDGDAIVRM
jgi:hypothetical protein